MKVQIQDGEWRLRLLEDEVTQLCAGEMLACQGRLPGGLRLGFSVRLAESAVAGVGREGDVWQIDLPRAPVEHLKAHLPNRDGIDFPLGDDRDAPFRVLVQVDVHDSVKRRRRA